MKKSELTASERERYARHLNLEGLGPEGQLRLINGSAVIVGLGGIGSPVALYLAAAGVGRLGLVDADSVSLSNLQRQVIHKTRNVGMPKTRSAAEAVRELNPEVRTEEYPEFLTRENAEAVCRGYDLIVDASDSFAVKFLVNDTALRLDKPCVIGGINRYRGMMLTHLPGTADLRSVFPEEPERTADDRCVNTGVLGVVAGMMGMLIATEAVKILGRIPEPMTDALLTFDLRLMEWNKLKLTTDNR